MGTRPDHGPITRTRRRPRRQRRRRRRRHLALAWLVLATLLLLALSPATIVRADTVVLLDERRLEGVIVDETDEALVLEMTRAGAMLRATLPRAFIAYFERDHRPGPPYCVLPIIGPVGLDVDSEQCVTARGFEAAIAEARRRGARHVVLVIDSGGGCLTETDQIVDLIAETRDLHFVAYVREALSAAAVIAMACRDICVAPGGVIGAAVPYQQMPRGTPAALEEKMQSAVRAGCRAAAEVGGHSPLLMRGMMETDLALALVTDDGGVRVVEAAAAPDAPVIKRKGEILTLTAGESVDCGLARGVVHSIDEIGPQLGVGPWHAVDDRPWHRLVNLARQERREEIARRKQQRLLAERKAYLDEIRPELDRINARLIQLRARRKALQGAESQLRRQTDADLAAAEKALARAKADAAKSDNPFYFTSRATSTYTMQISMIRRESRAEGRRLQTARAEVEHEEQQLLERRHELLSRTPTGE